ncbi:hypothetical protein C8R45DRAFT_413170 [Mycena sanguinolenta]|nr:hypothetical protein C8R45DRAFT_413170 [Mycena sanguinolenta]
MSSAPPDFGPRLKSGHSSVSFHCQRRSHVLGSQWESKHNDLQKSMRIRLGWMACDTSVRDQPEQGVAPTSQDTVVAAAEILHKPLQKCTPCSLRSGVYRFPDLAPETLTAQMHPAPVVIRTSLSPLVLSASFPSATPLPHGMYSRSARCPAASRRISSISAGAASPLRFRPPSSPHCGTSRYTTPHLDASLSTSQHRTLLDSAEPSEFPMRAPELCLRIADVPTPARQAGPRLSPAPRCFRDCADGRCAGGRMRFLHHCLYCNRHPHPHLRGPCSRLRLCTHLDGGLRVPEGDPAAARLDTPPPPLARAQLVRRPDGDDDGCPALAVFKRSTSTLHGLQQPLRPLNTQLVEFANVDAPRSSSPFTALASHTPERTYSTLLSHRYRSARLFASPYSAGR